MSSNVKISVRVVGLNLDNNLNNKCLKIIDHKEVNCGNYSINKMKEKTSIGVNEGLDEPIV